MKYTIFKDGAKINTVVGPETVIRTYCGENGYTYKAITPPTSEEPEPTPTEIEQLRADVDYIAVMTGVSL